MKKYVLFLILLHAYSVKGIAQASETAPGIEFKKITWVNQNLQQHQTEEDWWYGHNNVYDQNGNQTGFIACGFTSAVNWVSPSEPNGCYDSGPLGYNCNDFETSSWQKGHSRGTLGLFNLKGEMIWCKWFNKGGDLQSVVQTEDGGFIAVGTTLATISKDGTTPLYYNPTGSGSPTDHFTTTSCATKNPGSYEPGLGPWSYNIPHFNIMKVNNLGVIEWDYIYGAAPYGANDGREAFLSRSGGFGIVRKGSNYIVCGYAQPSTSVNTRIFVVEINENGKVLKSNTINEGGVEHSDAWGIDKDPLGNGYVISGIISDKYEYPGDVFKRNGAYAMRLDNNLNKVGSSFYPPNNTPIITYHNGQRATSVKFRANGNILLPAITNCNFCKWYENNYGDLMVFELANNTAFLSSINLGQVQAADLMAGITITDDGGFAVVSSKKYVTTHNYQLPDPNCDYSKLLNIYDTDAYIAKFDASNNKEWDMQFDADNYAPSQPFPGDIKRAECVYQITQTQDGGLVISGNTSHNFDDNYLVKLYGNCAIKAQYNVYGNSSDNNYTAMIINGSQGPPTITWNTNKKVRGDIIIRSGGELIIDGATIEFADSRRFKDINTRILVETGGKLTIKNGAVLKALNECDGAMWDGIFLYGNFSGTQTSSNQARINITNSTIENARTAIRCGSGAMLEASNSSFIDNYQSITMHQYRRMVNGIEIDNSSYIVNCDFICNGPMRDPYYKNAAGNRSGILDFIKLEEVKGIKIFGNRFNNNSGMNIEERGTAINAFNAGFYFNEYCIPGATIGSCTGYLKPEINNMYIGIQAISSNPAKHPITIANGSFEDNVHAINTSGIDFVKVHHNNFTLPPPNAVIYAMPSGITMYSSNDFKIESNNFFGQGSFNAGAVLDNCGTKNNVFYKNTFTNFFSSSQFQQNNAELQVKCNDYSLNYYDITVTSGTLGNQGQCVDLKSPAGNTFEHEGFGLNVWRNWGVYSFQYRHHSSNITEPLNNNLDPGDVIPCNDPHSSESCPSTISGGGGTDVIKWKEDYYDAVELYNGAGPGSEAADYYMEVQNHALSNVIHYYYHDSSEVAVSRDSLFLYLSYSDDYRPFLMGLYAREHMYDEARSIAEELISIPEYETFTKVQLLTIDMDENEISYTDSLNADEALRLEVEAWAALEDDFGAAHALALLSGALGYEYPIVIEEVEEGFQMMAQTDSSQVIALEDAEMETDDFFHLYPNPSVSMVTVEYGFKEVSEKNYIEITSFIGKRQLIQKFSSASGKDVIDVSGLASGIYLAHLVSDGARVKTIKMVIQK